MRGATVGTSPLMETRRPSRRRRLGLLLSLLLAIGVVVAIVLGSESSASSGGSTNASVSSGAVAVQRRNLVETDTESGTLSYANTYTVYNRLSGTITWLPAVGQVIKPGQALYKVGNEPVTLMDGTTPAYRDLKSSDSAGPDILELNQNLIKLGFDAGGIVADDEWQAATTDGVELFQESLGETQTGDLTLGQVVFLPGDQLISTVSATEGSDGSGGASQASYDPPAGGSSAEFVSLTKSSGSSSPSTTPSSTSPGAGNGSSPGTSSGSCKPSSGSKSTPKSGSSSDAGSGSGSGSNPSKKKKRSCKPSGSVAALTALLNAATAELRAETAELGAERGGGGSPGKSGSGSPSGSGGSGSGGSGSGSGGSGSGGSGSGSGGSGGGGATAIMQTSSTELVATVDLDATKQSEARVGEVVQVELPDGSYVGGRISAVSPVAQSSGGSGAGGSGGGGSGGGGSSSGAVIPVTISLGGRRVGAGLDQAAVSVNFSEAQARNVLSVPVTALLATSGGNYEVQEAAAPHALIAVTTGLFAAGYVQISGPGVYEGLEVTDSQG